MRTTITIPDELALKARKLTGKPRLSEAITQSLNDYFSLKNRLEFLDEMTRVKPPHDWKKIKADRRKRNWSA